MVEPSIKSAGIQSSIIIPCLNESGTLGHTLTNLLSSLQDPSQAEIIVCDGGSQDDTLDVARQFPVVILTSRPGRARQMNRAAQKATGDWLLFLHSDTRLPVNWEQLIQQSRSDWGRFDVRLSGQHFVFRVIEKTINLRSRITSIATGDQALFFRRDFFNQLGGFPEIPLMEDIAMSQQARRLASPCCVREPVVTSSRRWEHNGIVRTILLMWWLRLAYWLGVKPETLYRLYYP